MVAHLDRVWAGAVTGKVIPDRSVDRNRRLIEFVAVHGDLARSPVHCLGQRVMANLVGDDVHIFAQRRLEVLRMQYSAVGLEEFDASRAVQDPQGGHSRVVVLSCHVSITPVGRVPDARFGVAGDSDWH